MEYFAPRYHVIAVDAWSSGKSPRWPADRPLTLRDEVALLEPVLERARGPVSLVGHSYGAAVALIAAMEFPERISSLVLYEPVLFSVIDEQSPSPNEADGFREAFDATAALLDAGDAIGAGRCFVDYWSGEGSWERMPEARRAQVAASIASIGDWAHACLAEPTPLRAFSWLGAPVLLMTGQDSPVSSRAVARLLTQALPRVQRVEFAGVGHMGPVTHPEIVNGVISRFLERHRPFHQADPRALVASPSAAG
jgi:pimeloyl-ACP methyl ester carboxylesterase